MGSYVVIDAEILDQKAFSEFATKIRPVVVAGGGTFLVRGGDIEVVEGDWTPQRLVVIGFDGGDAAGHFVRSAEYAALRELRSRAVRSRVLVATGYDE